MTASTGALTDRRGRYNFSGGPGALPEEVLREAQQAIVEVPGTGLSVLGLGHRTAWFRDVVDETVHHLRCLLNLSDGYEVLLLQGGASLQFSMVPMALLRGREQPADYVLTGYWSAKALPEAQREGPVRALWDGSPAGYTRLPNDGELDCNPRAPYLHYVSNETVEGLQFHRVLGFEGVPRVCDMSSDFLSTPVDATRFALIYAHAQKNLGPAGVTVVVIRREVMDAAPADLPAMLDYRRHAHMGSIYNTPPVFAIYVTLLVMRWLRGQPGGLRGVAERNEAKAARLYGLLDASGGFYRPRAALADRSHMNVVFTLPSVELEREFLRRAEAAGLSGLEGHRTLGGVRASLYNAVTLDDVAALCAFMQEFQCSPEAR